ncbi:MAG: DUF349 domain-containing protein [Pseudomonadota bacterium]
MLDRFKKSALQDADMDVRLDALLQLDLTDERFLKALAEDPEPAVRAQLVARVVDVDTLVARAGDDAASRVRDAAGSRLREVLTSPQNRSAETLERFIETCSDADLLAYLSIHASGVDPRRSALTRHASVAPDENAHQLLQLAVASRENDAGLQQEAQSAIDDPEILEKLIQATRKSDKVSHRFARARQRAQREATLAEDRIGGLVEDLNRRAAERIAATNEALHEAVARQQQWAQRWKSASAEGEAPDVSVTVAELESAIECARTAIHEREALLATVRAHDGALDADGLRARWSQLTDTTPRENEQFEQGLIAWATLEKKLAEAGSAWDAAVALLDAADAPGATTTLRGFERAWAALSLGEPADDAQRAVLARHETRLEVLRESARKADAARERAVAQGQDLLNKLRSALDEGRISDATSACDRLSHRLKVREHLDRASAAPLEKGLAELSPRLAELKQARIWSTQQARQELIAEVEALTLQADTVAPKALANRIRGLRTKWRELDHGIGPAHQDIWARFDTACKAAYAPAKAHFDAEAKSRSANRGQREAVCAELEQLAAQTDWENPDFKSIEAALAQSRKAWRDTGPVNHRDIKRLRKRYDAAQDAIEARLGPEREREMRRRQLAIKSLETAMANEPLPSQNDLAKRIQREWAPTVRGRRRDEQTLWDQLRALCDQVFEQRNAETKARRSAQGEAVHAREAILAELSTLADQPAADSAAAKAITAAYAALKTRWQEAGDVHPKQRHGLQRRYRDLCKKLDSARTDAKRRAGARDDQAMLSALEAVDARWSALAAGDAEGAQPDTSGVRGPLAKELGAAAASTPACHSGSTARAELCLRAELDADVESPSEFASARMQLKIERLNAAMSGARQPAPRALVGELVSAWLKTPLAGDTSDAATWSRFKTALDALVHRR